MQKDQLAIRRALPLLATLRDALRGAEMLFAFALDLQRQIFELENAPPEATNAARGSSPVASPDLVFEDLTNWREEVAEALDLLDARIEPEEDPRGCGFRVTHSKGD